MIENLEFEDLLDPLKSMQTSKKKSFITYIYYDIFNKFIFGSVFIYTLPFIVFIIIYSAIVNYWFMSNEIIYNNLYNIFKESLIIMKFVDIVIGFGAFFIIINFQSGNETYKHHGENLKLLLII